MSVYPSSVNKCACLELGVDFHANPPQKEKSTRAPKCGSYPMGNKLKKAGPLLSVKASEQNSLPPQDVLRTCLNMLMLFAPSSAFESSGSHPGGETSRSIRILYKGIPADLVNPQVSLTKLQSIPG